MIQTLSSRETFAALVLAMIAHVSIFAFTLG